MTTLRLALVLLCAASLLSAGCGESAPAGKSLAQQQADALKLSDGGQRARKLAQLAVKQQQAGDLLGLGSSLASAKEAALSVKDPGSRASALIFVAEYYAKLEQSASEVQGILREAAKAAEEVSSPDVKIRTLADLAAATGTHLKNPTLAASYLQTAEQAVVQLPGVVLQAAALSRIAVAYHKLERAEDASRIIGQAQELARNDVGGRKKCDALAEIGAALARMKRDAEATAAFAEAEQMAAEISEADGQAYALLQLARTQQAAGKKEAAKATLAKASQLAEKVTDGSIRGPLITEIEAERQEL